MRHELLPDDRVSGHPPGMRPSPQAGLEKPQPSDPTRVPPIVLDLRALVVLAFAVVYLLASWFVARDGWESPSAGRMLIGLIIVVALLPVLIPLLVFVLRHVIGIGIAIWYLVGLALGRAPGQSQAPPPAGAEPAITAPAARAHGSEPQRAVEETFGGWPRVWRRRMAALCALAVVPVATHAWLLTHANQVVVGMAVVITSAVALEGGAIAWGVRRARWYRAEFRFHDGALTARLPDGTAIRIPPGSLVHLRRDLVRRAWIVRRKFAATEVEVPLGRPDADAVLGACRSTFPIGETTAVASRVTAQPASGEPDHDAS